MQTNRVPFSLASLLQRNTYSKYFRHMELIKINSVEAVGQSSD